MPRMTVGCRSAALTVAVLLAAYPRFAGATTTTTYIGADGGSWTVPGNWDNGVPNSSGFDAVIGGVVPVTVQLDATETINNLSVNSSATLSLLTTLTLSGASIANSGSILFNATTSNPTLYLNGNATYSGSGTLLLANTNSAITVSQFLPQTDFSNTSMISGSGTIGNHYFRLYNSGTITATAGVLDIATTSINGIVNRGVLRSNGGTLVLGASDFTFSNATFDNTGGLIEATNGSPIIVRFDGLLSGGTISSVGGSVFLPNQGLSNVSFIGTSTYFDFSKYTGTLTNSGTLNVSNGLTFEAPGALLGGGTLLMTQANSVLRTLATLTLDNTILGKGTVDGASQTLNSGLIVGAGGTLNVKNLNNTGILRADGGTLIVAGISNTLGIIEAFSNATVGVSGSVDGGLIRTVDNGTVSFGGSSITVSNATLSNLAGAMRISSKTITLQGVAILGNIAASGATLSIGGIFQNYGSLGLSAVTLKTTSGTLSDFGYLLVNAGTTQMPADLHLAGAGTIVLTSPTSIFAQTSGAASRLLTNDSIIMGQGTIGNGTAAGLKISNSGTIIATTGLLTIAPPNTTSGFVNTGVLRADGGSLVLAASTYTNTGGIIEAIHNSTVTVNSGARLIGGVIDGSTGTVSLLGVSLATLSLQGNTQLGAGYSTMSGMISLTGSLIMANAVTLILSGATVNNSGSIFMGAGSVHLTGNSSLIGGGVVNLASVNSNFTGTAGIRLFTDNSITGQGNLGRSNLKFVNSGSIIASAGLLTIAPRNATDGFNSAGVLRADNGSLAFLASTYAISGAVEAIHGGVLNFSSGIFSISCPISLADNSSVLFNATSQNIAGVTGIGLASVGANAVLKSDGVTVTGLTIGANGLHAIRVNGGNTGTSKVNAITLGTAGDGSFSARLDVNDNNFIVEGDGAVPGDKGGKALYLQGAMFAGMDGGDYLGKGITSGTVAADWSATGSHSMTLALLDNADFGFSTFGGQGVDGNSLMIETAKLGDADLDGVVGYEDFKIWYQHALERSPFTERGDFNHDGGVDGLDFDLWFAAAGSGGQGVLDGLGLDRGVLSALRAPPPAPVPEGGSLGMVLVVGPWLLRRRRGGVR